MNQKTTHQYATEKVDTFLGIDKKMYIGIFAILFIYMLACVIAFVEYILNDVDIVHKAAVFILFLLGMVPAWILAESYYLSKEAVRIEGCLESVEKGVLSWKMLSRVCKRKNTVRLVDRMLRKGFLTGMYINVEHKVLVLEEKYKKEKSKKEYYR